MAISESLKKSVKDTLVAGKYSLFIGAGANDGGFLSNGEKLPLSDDLRKKIVELKGLKPGLHPVPKTPS